MRSIDNLLYSVIYFNKQLFLLYFIKYKLFFNFIFFSVFIYRKFFKKIILNAHTLEIYTDPENALNLFFFLKNFSLLKFKTLVDIVVVDSPKNKHRFEIIYNLLSIFCNVRLNICLQIKDLTALYSVTSLYSSALWLERECWDMFGLFFFNNGDLRRILTDYGFVGHPLRKDFPLTGFKEIFFDDSKKSIVKTSVSLAQEFRNFHFRRIWKK